MAYDDGQAVQAIATCVLRLRWTDRRSGRATSISDNSRRSARQARLGYALVSDRIRRALWIGGAALLLIGVPVLWKWTPLSEWATVENGVAWFSTIRSSNYVAVWVVVLYSLGAVLFLPINLFIFLTALFFDNVRASLFVAVGVAVNAATGYVIGRVGVSILVSRINSARVTRISGRLANADFVELFLFRLVPVTPFSTINVLCGTLRIPVLRFFAATFASIAPGATLIILFEHALVTFSRDMSWRTGLLLSATLAALVGGAFLVKRWAASRG